MAENRPAKVGLIGCGNISGIYLENGKKLRAIEIVHCADIDIPRAKATASERGIAKAGSPDDLLADPEVEIVINLTVPTAHFSVCRAALEAGKHVYVEKPLSLTCEEGAELLALAGAKGLRLGGAPDTFLGAGLQTCRKLIDDGWIGEPVGAIAHMITNGPEGWHPNPGFFYQQGGGPMFDMGPYYLAALVHLLGPIQRVTGSARITLPERTATSEARFGERLPVAIPTYIAATLDMASGPVVQLMTTFDTFPHERYDHMVVYGTEGALIVPDTNTFGGPVKVRRGWGEVREVPLLFGYHENSRGLGVADMATAIRESRPHRASGELANHVLEAMYAVHAASESERHYHMTTRVDRPAPMNPHALPGEV